MTDAMQLDSDKARLLWEEVRKNAQAGKCDFSEQRFPEDPAGRGFKEIAFTALADFTGAEFTESIDFTGATFEDRANFAGATFEKKVYFRDATFKGESNFGDVTFVDYVNFGGAKFEGGAFFARTQFKGTANFQGATIQGYARFSGAVFHADARFEESLFCKYACFSAAQFMSHAVFYETQFHQDVDFSDVFFHASFLIAAARIQGKLVLNLPWSHPRPFAFVECGEEAYRLAKQTAQNHGNYRMAGEYHFAEQCTINSHMRNEAWKMFWEKKRWLQSVPALFSSWGELLIGRYLSGYGERPLRPLLAGVAVIFIYAAIFCAGGVIINNGTPSHGFSDSMYLSLVTFTTLGYGDVLPVSGLRFVASTEAFLGGALMALFIVVLSRKYVR